MTDAVTDTHSLIWYLQDSPKLGKEANTLFEACDRGEALIYIPTICLVEIVYLTEKGRIQEKLSEELQTDLQANSTNFVLADLTGGVVKGPYPNLTKASSRYARPNYCSYRPAPRMAAHKPRPENSTC